MEVVRNIFKKIIHSPGWVTKRKIVVFESDDWGSIRMPSKNSFEKLKALGLPVDEGDSGRYNRFDTLAGIDDFDALFNLLRKFKDSKGDVPVITAMSLVANPDFDKIRNSGFTEYAYEPFTATLKRYGLEKSFDYWKQGVQEKVFVPQFHGREHLNVPLWMRALQSGDFFTLSAFEEGCWGFRNKAFSAVNFQAAFDLDQSEDLIIQQDILQSGLDLFEKLHGYRASFFVPPNGPFNLTLSKVAADGGIRYISTAKKALEPLGNNKYKTRYHYLGKRINNEQVFITRNCSFEPSYTGVDWVSTCLKEIDFAFSIRKPAIVSTHRVNYIGAHDERNRTESLKALESLLAGILRKWPDVEFLTSSELGDLITKQVL